MPAPTPGKIVSTVGCRFKLLQHILDVFGMHRHSTKAHRKDNDNHRGMQRGAEGSSSGVQANSLYLQTVH